MVCTQQPALNSLFYIQVGSQKWHIMVGGVRTLNVPLMIIPGTLFSLILNFTGSGHHGHITQKTEKKSLNEPLGGIADAFFGKIQDVSINFPMGTSQSHDLEHCECTDNSLGWENSECT